MTTSTDMVPCCASEVKACDCWGLRCVPKDGRVRRQGNTGLRWCQRIGLVILIAIYTKLKVIVGTSLALISLYNPAVHFGPA